MENQPFLLIELEDLSSIFAPLKSTSRIRYTCFSVSNNFLIFGATSGGLYVFRREPCCFLQLLPNKEGSVTQVAISPDQKLIAFSTIKGIVCVLERSSHSAKHLVSSLEHQNEQITSLQWNEGSNELFVGDNSGKVSVLTVSIFPTTSMFQTPSFVLMQLDSKIVQMDLSSNMLLVSTLTKCYICDTSKEIFRQVGHKLRDGEYGACIFNTQTNDNVILDSGNAETEKISSSEYSSLSHLKLLCARPGSRVWEVAIDGTVISTHHFKEALAVPPRKIIFLKNSSSLNSNVSNSILANGSSSSSSSDGVQINSNYCEQSFNFQKLYVILSKFFFTFKSDGIYVFDPQKASVVLWNNEITNIVDVKSVSDVIYVWTNHGKVYALNLVPLEKLLIRLYFQKKYLELGKVCLDFESYLLAQGRNSNKLYVLHDLDEKLKSDENSDHLTERLKPIISICKENVQKRKIQNAQILQSGIYLVNNNDQILGNDRRAINQKLPRPSYLNLKGRSHSVSPERFQNGGLKHRGSSSSLPDLIKERKSEENANSKSEILVNGREEGENEAVTPKPDSSKVYTEDVLRIMASIKKASEPSKEMIFNFLDQIWSLFQDKQSIDGRNLELAEPLPLKSYFDEGDVKFISDLFHFSLRSKFVLEWLSSFSGDWLTNAIDSAYPDLLLKNHSSKTLELDYKFSKVLKLFSDVLNETEIVECLRKAEMECYYCSLIEILDVYRDSSLSSVSESTLNLANVTSTPKILNIVYFLMNVGQIDQCSKYSEVINFQDIFYLMLRFEKVSKESGKSPEIIELQCHTLFLSYLDKTSQRNQLISTCDELIENYIINCLETINCSASSVRESTCSCGFPSPGVQATINMFPDVAHALVDKTWPRNPDKCMEICGRISYLWKYFIFIRRNESLESLLPLILQSGEIQELEARSEEVDRKVLELAIKCLADLKRGKCLNCGEEVNLENGTVTWTELGMLSVKLLGPKETLEAYMKYADDIDSTELSQSFYQSLIFTTIMDRKEKGLRKNIVDSLMGKSESCQVPVFSEHIRKEILGEGRSDKFSLGEESESKSHHWGVKVNFKNNCLVCSLPLNTKILVTEAGLVVFKCSHVFHSACLGKVKLECPVCKNTDTE